jgi:phosphohistidine phosphatase
MVISRLAPTTIPNLNAQMPAEKVIMEIYLMRHGEAVSASEWRGADADRPLTVVGRAKLLEALDGMRRVKFSVPHVLTSPYLRAKETAEMFCKQLGLQPPQVVRELSSGANNETLRRVVTIHKASMPMLIVGHMPEIAIFGSRITTEPSVMDKGLQPADILALDAGPLDQKWGEGKVLWWRTMSDWKKLPS